MHLKKQHFNNIIAGICIIIILVIGALTLCTISNNTLYNVPQDNIIEQTDTIKTESTKKVPHIKAGSNAVTYFDILTKENREQYLKYQTTNRLEDRYAETLQAVQLALAQYDIPFDIEKCYSEYLNNINEVNKDETSIEGIFGPAGTVNLINRYLEDDGYSLKAVTTNELDTMELVKIINNHWPILIYYTNQPEKVPNEIRYWPYAEVFLGYTTTEDTITLFHPILGEQTYYLEPFMKTWTQCGRHLISFFR
jgi:hypothetical protein